MGCSDEALGWAACWRFSLALGCEIVQLGLVYICGVERVAAVTLVALSLCGLAQRSVS